MKEDKLIKKLFTAQAHFGHQKRLRNPKLKSFIYCTVNKIDIINLEFTVKQIKEAKSFICKYSRDDVLVVSSRDDLNLNGVKLVSKWKPGMLTNFKFSLLTKTPKLLIVDNASDNIIAFKEANYCDIKAIGLCDTNSSIENMEQFIVMNDDNDKAAKLVINYLI